MQEKKMTFCPNTCRRVLAVWFQGALVIQADIISQDREVP